MEGIFWLLIVIVMAIIEIATMGLTTIWFAGGALAAFVTSLFGAGLPVQIIVFIVVSFLLIVFTRPLAVKFMNKGKIRTNAESLIGKNAVVSEDIHNLKATGAAQVNGQEWTARSVDDTVIVKDTVVEIVEIKGVKLIVKPREK